MEDLTKGEKRSIRRSLAELFALPLPSSSVSPKVSEGAVSIVRGVGGRRHVVGGGRGGGGGL